MTELTDAERKKAWPRYAVSPEGMRARFDCMGDVPARWKLEVPLPGSEAADPQLAGLRAAYSALYGKKPGPTWDAEALLELIGKKAA